VSGREVSAWRGKGSEALTPLDRVGAGRVSRSKRVFTLREGERGTSSKVRKVQGKAT